MRWFNLTVNARINYPIRWRRYRNLNLNLIDDGLKSTRACERPYPSNVGRVVPWNSSQMMLRRRDVVCGTLWLTEGFRTSISLFLPTDSSSILSNNCVSTFSAGIPSGLRAFHEPSGSSRYLIPWVRPPPRPGSEGVFPMWTWISVGLDLQLVASVCGRIKASSICLHCLIISILSLRIDWRISTNRRIHFRFGE